MLLDTGFRPSKHGFAFANTWQDTLFGVVPSRGRCGGMVFAALDSFIAGEPLEASSGSPGLPPHDSPLARRILQRQIESVAIRLGANLWQSARFTYLPSAGPLGVAQATRRELLTLFDALRLGWPVPLGLISDIGLTRIARNHQVLAYAATFGEDMVTVRVYDPNHPRSDDVVLEIALSIDEPVVERARGSVRLWRGLFVEHYAPKCAKSCVEEGAVSG